MAEVFVVVRRIKLTLHPQLNDGPEADRRLAIWSRQPSKKMALQGSFADRRAKQSGLHAITA